MKKIVLTLIAAVLFLGCSSKGATDEDIEPKLVINKTLAGLTFNDQNEKAHTLELSTEKIIFAFSKDVGHSCNNYFGTKDISYLKNNNIVFIADVSAAPSLIRSMIVMPGLKEFKYTILVLDDEKVAAPFRAGIDKDKIIVVDLNNGVISDVKSLNSISELSADLETK